MSRANSSSFSSLGGIAHGRGSSTPPLQAKRVFTSRHEKISTPLTCTFPVSIHRRLQDTELEADFVPIRMPTVMSFVTYTLLTTLLAGLHGSFDPSLLLATGSSVLAIILTELLILYLGSYLLSVSAESRFLDLVAYAGYKFVGVIATLVIAEVLNRSTGGGTGGAAGWSVFLYAYLANAFFLLRSLKYVLLPDQSAAQPGVAGGGGSYTLARAQRNRRTQFLFVYAYVVQFVFMWALSRQDPAAAVQQAAAATYKVSGNVQNAPPGAAPLAPGGAAAGKGGAVI